MSHPPPLAIPGRFGVPNASGQKFNKACDPKNGSSCAFSPIGPRRRPVRSKNDRIVELERRVRDMQLKLERQVEKQVERRASAINVVGSEADRDAPGAESFAEAPPAPGSHPNNKPAPPFSFVPGPGSPEPKPASTQTEPESSTHESADKSCGDILSGPTTVESHPTAASDDAVACAADPKAARYGPDVVDRGLITLSQADKLINRFRQFIHGKFLGIGIPDGYSNQSLRRNKPAVWLSVLCAASTGSAEFLSVASVLSSDLEKILDEQVQEDLEPDLDILQALAIFYIFHNDPTQSMRERFFECNKMVVAIVIKLGQASKIHNLPEGVPITEADVTERALDLSRQLCIWHWTSFSLAVKARENILIRPFSLVNSSLRILETSGNQCDMSLIEWIKLIQIAVEGAFALFNGHDRAEGLSDEGRDSIIQYFERKRRQWLINCPFDLVNEFLMLEYHYTALVLTEVIYPAGRADFHARSHGLPSLSCPSQSPASTETDNTDTKPDQDVLAPYRIQYTQKCITAAHACLTLVVEPPGSPGLTSTNSLADAETLRYFSNVPYSRLFYALRFLMIVAHNIWRTGEYDLVNIDSLRPGYYIEGIKRVLAIASDGGRFRPPSLWLYAIQTRIEPWWEAFRARLERDRPPPSRPRSSGEVEGTPEATPPSTTGVTPPSAAHQKPRRQTSEPLPPGYDRTSESPFAGAPQPPAPVPYDIFSASQAMDFLIPFNFVQQAPPVAAAAAIPGNPNLGPQPFACSPPPGPPVRGGGSGGGQTGSSGTTGYTTSSSPPAPGSSRQASVSGSGEDQAAAAATTAATTAGGYDLGATAFDQGEGLGYLDDYLETMDLDAFNWNWGEYGALFPGAEAFLPDPSVLPLTSPFVGEAPGGGPQEDGTEGS
ncbi:hypothetical protein INS49_008981 [Diaporthe citri]|uniref:uncharacterized protein n=1 Tax=Diaporthe citri TaxID=83186 RepID=UPI001C81ED84|nr:uncharacterized protein INS49_008981 [Diaporthe citri]KAG6363878.1 hypothetical protein INS49_008981 [Diaporthe citri]